jgi:hypothetical protein
MSRFLSKIGSKPPTRRARHSVAPAVLAIMVGSLCIALPALGALYKWTDANGRVVYSDQAPSGDVKVETIAGPPPPANRNAVKEMANKEAEGKKQKLEAADNAKKVAQTQADAEKHASMCKDARAQITALSADQVLLYKVNEKGETVVMDDADRRRRRDTLETFLKANCTGG